MKMKPLAIILSGLLFYTGAGFTASCHGQNQAETVSSDDDTSGVVSHTPTEPPHEFTREEMLLAQPMPMSGEERDFVFKHKSVQKLNEWTYKDYKDYVSSAIGRQTLFGEGQRWIDIHMMLRAQAQFAEDFVAGKVKAPQPLPARPERRKQLQDNAVTGDGDGDNSNQSGAAGDSSAPGASAGYPGDDGGGQPGSMNLRENMSDDELFLKNSSDLNGADGEALFKKLKALRAEISTCCKRLDAATSEAKKKGLGQALENHMSAVDWE